MALPLRGSHVATLFHLFPAFLISTPAPETTRVNPQFTLVVGCSGAPRRHLNQAGGWGFMGHKVQDFLGLYLGTILGGVTLMGVFMA